MIVTSPGFGVGLSSGIYCFTASLGVSESPCAVAATYSLVWHPVTVCSTTRKDDAILLTVYRCPSCTAEPNRLLLPSWKTARVLRIMAVVD